MVASVGSSGDSDDNAMAESFNRLFKWELIYPAEPVARSRRRVRHPWLHRLLNHRRLHDEITDDNTYAVRAESVASYYREAAPAHR